MDYQMKFEESQAEAAWEMIRNARKHNHHYLPHWWERSLSGISAQERFRKNYLSQKNET